MIFEALMHPGFALMHIRDFFKCPKFRSWYPLNGGGATPPLKLLCTNHLDAPSPLFLSGVSRRILSIFEFFINFFSIFDKLFLKKNFGPFWPPFEFEWNLDGGVPPAMRQAKQRNVTLRVFYHTSTWRTHWRDIITVKLLQRQVPLFPPNVQHEMAYPKTGQSCSKVFGFGLFFLLFLFFFFLHGLF